MFLVFFSDNISYLKFIDNLVFLSQFVLLILSDFTHKR